jgi:hypothetical protein
MFGGETYPVKTGETKQYPRFLAEHLANQLANKILISQDKSWTEAEYKKPLLDRIMGSVSVEAVEAPVEEKEPEFAEAPVEIPWNSNRRNKYARFVEIPVEEPVKPKKRGTKKK